jgi:hypothetical protein
LGVTNIGVYECRAILSFSKERTIWQGLGIWMNRASMDNTQK